MIKQQLDEQELFDVECEKVGAQMLVDLAQDGEFRVALKNGASKLFYYQDLVAEFAENNPILFCDALSSDKKQFEEVALQLAEKWRDFVIEQIDNDHAIEHVYNQEH